MALCIQNISLQIQRENLDISLVFLREVKYGKKEQGKTISHNFQEENHSAKLKYRGQMLR